VVFFWLLLIKFSPFSQAVDLQLLCDSVLGIVALSMPFKLLILSWNNFTQYTSLFLKERVSATLLF